MEISSIRENIKARIFNSTRHEATVSRASNPFSKTSFKGNVLTADVFESASKIVEKATPKNKLTMSTLVGSISNLGSRLQAGLESIAAFGNRMKENIVNTWNKYANMEISFAGAGKAISEKWNAMFETTNAKTLAKNHSVDELGCMLESAITDYMAVAA